MLHGQDLLNLVVGDVQSRNGSIRSLIEVAQARGAPPVRCVLSKVTVKALEKWINASGKRRTDHLFSGREDRRALSVRQLSRLVKLSAAEAGLDSRDYGIVSLRRTKALHILRGTGDLQTVRALLGQVQIGSTARYLGLKTRVAVSRSSDI
jgi:site-specific recombinase XerD